MKNLLFACLFTAVWLFSGGCQLEKFFPQDVGDGVARLSMRNAGAITVIVSENTECGFESPTVKAMVQTVGEDGEFGYAVWAVKDCVIQFESEAIVSPPNCQGEGETVAKGTIAVTGTRTVHGILTGDANNPVLPITENAVQMSFQVDFDNLAIRDSDDPNVLTMKSGSVSFSMSPRMAESAQVPGVCAAVTPNVLFRDLQYQSAYLHVQSPQRSFDVDVATSDLAAVNGLRREGENAILGTVQVWDTEVEVSGALNPDYDPDEFLQNFAEEDCLARQFAEDPDVHTPTLPLQYTCEGINDLLVPGATRLTLRNIGVIASLTEKDVTCGFSAPHVMSSYDEVAEGEGKGRAVYTVSNCEINFPNDTVISSDCQGVETTVKGRVTVTATKTLQGRLTHNPDSPVVPLDDSPATIHLQDVVFDAFQVKTSDRVESLVQESGHLEATIIPRTAVDADRGVCAVSTSIARFSEVRYENARVTLQTAQGQFSLPIDSAELSAVVGRWGNEENSFSGSMTVRGEKFLLPFPGDEGIIPDFDADSYDLGWNCKEELARPISYECDAEPRIISGAARLTIRQFGNVIDALESDTNCGFSSPAVVDGVLVEGTLGEDGATAEYIVEDCLLDFPERKLISEDCNGTQTWIQGRVLVNASKTLSGIMTGDNEEPIVPTSWSPAVIDAVMSFEGLQVEMSGKENYLRVEKGLLEGRLRPRTGLDESRGACSIATSVIAFDNLRYTDGELRVFRGDSWTQINVSDSNISAQNGPGETRVNYLSGSITTDGITYQVPYDTGEPVLDPDFDLQSFQDSYACKENLVIPQSVEECSFNKVLGEGAARLLIQAMGEAAGMINGDSSCGFENLGVKMNSEKWPANGDVGEMGSLTFMASQCDMQAGPGQPGASVSVDCVGKEKFREGSMTVSATRVVEGELDAIEIFGIKIADSIVPKDPQSVSIDLENIVFNEFVNYGRGPNGEEDPGVLTLHQGTASGMVRPALGEQEDEPGSFMVPTPIAAIENVSLSNISATLVSEGKTFRLQLDDAQLNAFNGAYGGQENAIEGTIRVNGESVVLAPQDLNPDYDQAAFDASYVCTENLMALLPSNGGTY